MSIWKKTRYNKRSAKKLGWDPAWFEASDFDEQLINNIKTLQLNYGLKVDGMCGPMTFRRISSEREAKSMKDTVTEQNFIICDGEKVPVEWNKVINIYDINNYALPSSCYRNYKKNKRKVTMIVTHFDVCLSANSCRRVLEKKGISSHFVIDNDGAICQMVDPQHAAWHAGNGKVNKASIGVDLSNGVYTKYQKWYRARGHGSRPILTDVEVHGVKVKECLGFYPVQIAAYKALVKALCKHYNIPIAMPKNSEGKVLRAVHKDTTKARFEGIVNHYHITRNKWDTANLDWDKILQELTT